MTSLFDFTQALLDPSKSLATLKDARAVLGADNMPRVERTTRFAEGLIMWQSRRYLACLPLSESALFAVEPLCTRLRYLDSPYLASYRLLPAEIDGQTPLVLQELPAGLWLEEAITRHRAETLLQALDTMALELRKLGFFHNNLKPENLIFTPDGRMVPVRYHFASFATGNDAPRLKEVRQWILAQACAATDAELTKAAPALPRFEGHLHVGQMSDQLICVQDQCGWGFVDTLNRPVIASTFAWCSDFREGRAEVQVADGRMGLIDKAGDWVIEPLYRMLEFNPYTGCTRVVRDDGQWAIADYNGVLGDFSERFIEENEYVK